MNQISWYRSDPEHWVLDRQRWRDAFVRKGVSVGTGDHDERCNFDVLGDTAAMKFLARMEPFRVSREKLAEELAEVLPAVETWLDIADFLPKLFVDFDAKTLYSIEVESWGFENYVPSGWQGLSEGFFDRIDLSERYWIVGGRDQVARFIEGQDQLV
jgi:hypothetical protein